MFKIGDLVTRKKYGNDIIFKIDKIQNNTIYLKGVDVRLYADTKEDDLILATIPKKKEINEEKSENKIDNKKTKALIIEEL